MDPSRPQAGINGGVGLDGVNDHVAVANSASLNPSSAITVAAWFKANTTAGSRS